jgi:hypothetical protein
MFDFPTISISGVSIVQLCASSGVSIYGPQIELRLRARGPWMAPNYFDSMNHLSGELFGTRQGQPAEGGAERGGGTRPRPRRSWRPGAEPVPLPPQQSPSYGRSSTPNRQLWVARGNAREGVAARTVFAVVREDPARSASRLRRVPQCVSDHGVRSSNGRRRSRLCPPDHGPLGVVTGVGVSEPTWRDVRSRDAHGWSAFGNEE